MKTAGLDLMSAAEAARYLGVHETTLMMWRKRGVGPMYFSMSGMDLCGRKRSIRYRKADIDAWVADKLEPAV